MRVPLPMASSRSPSTRGPQRRGTVAKHAWQLVPSSRYRHPGDVIRLIASGLVLIGALAAVAAAPGQLVRSGAPTVTWLGSGSAGRLLIGLVQVAFVIAAAAVVVARPALPPVPPAGPTGSGCPHSRRRAVSDLVPGRRQAPALGGVDYRSWLVAGRRLRSQARPFSPRRRR